MLEDRKYTVKNEIKNLSDNDFRYMYSNNKFNFTIENKNKKCFVLFFLNVAVKTNSIKENIINKKTNESDEFIIILKDRIKLNSSIYKLEKEFNCRIFWYGDLIRNITHHSYVPKHELATIEEINNFMINHEIENKRDLVNIPHILVSDPQSRYYNFKHGDIIKITRNCITSGKNVAYRYVK